MQRFFETTRRATWLVIGVGWALMPACVVEFDEGLLRRDGSVDSRVEDSRIDSSVEAALDVRPADGPEADVCVDTTCEEDWIVGCGGQIEQCHLGCVADPTPRCRRLVPRNGVPSPGGDHSGVLDLTGVDSPVVDLDACAGQLDGKSIPGAVSSRSSQENGPDIGTLQLRSVNIPAGKTLHVVGDCALALVADEGISIAGTLDLRGGANEVFIAGPGGGQGGRTRGGAGCGGGGSGGGGDGGGGGAGFGSAGGPGGAGGAGGETCGNEPIEPLLGGSGGGHGGCSPAPRCRDDGHGGGGGGAAMLVAGQRVILRPSGGINLGGAGGEGGARGRGGGGGGSGGALLIEAPEVQIDPAAIIAAGGGGGGGVTDADVTFARGERGRLALEAALGGQGLVDGGNGGTVGGADQDGLTGASNASGGGGGGGGLGRVRVNSRDGAVTLPSTNARVSQGTVRSD